MGAEHQITALITVASRLIDVMNGEIDALRRMRVADLGPLQDEKARLIAAYEASVRELKADPEMMLAVGEALRQEFAEIASRFNRVLADNERALHAAKVAHDRLMRAIVRAAEDDRAPFKGYASDGAPAGATRGAAAPGAPLAVDTSL